MNHKQTAPTFVRIPLQYRHHRISFFIPCCFFTRFCCVWCINSCNFCRWVWSSISTWRKATKQRTKQKKCHCELHTMGNECFLDIFMTKIFNFTLRPYNNSFAVRNVTVSPLNALTLMIFDLRSFPVVNFSTLIDLVFFWLAVILRISEPFRMEFKPLRYQNNRVKWR